MSNVKFSYDELNDVLYLHKEGIHARGSVMIGDFVLDLTANKEIAGVEILNATDLLKDYDITKDMLCTIQEARLIEKKHPNCTTIGILLLMPQKIKKEIMVTMPSVQPIKNPALVS